MNHQDAAEGWSPTWSLAGARRSRNGKWVLTFTRPVGPETTLGQIVSTLSEAHPRALEAVLTVDLRRRDRTMSAALYFDSRQAALEALALSRAQHPPVPGRLGGR
jgi:hypothetical protein